jgi:hypothetical protein
MRPPEMLDTMEWAASAYLPLYSSASNIQRTAIAMSAAKINLMLNNAQARLIVPQQ